VNYQEIFNEVYAQLGEKTARYDRLVFTLEAVFKAAGYTITGGELASRWHNYICSYIGITDLNQIARGFVGFASEAPRLPWEIEKVAAGEVRYDSWIYTGSILSPETVTGYQIQVEARLKRDDIRRRSRDYDAFIQAEAAQVGKAMRRDAQIGLSRHQAVLTDCLKEERALNKDAVEFAECFDRLVEIITAFEAIGGLAPTPAKQNLVHFARKMRDGIARREAVMAELETRSYDLDKFIAAAINLSPDLAALWLSFLAQEEA